MKIMIKIIEFPRELMRSCMWSQLKLLSVVEFVRFFQAEGSDL